MVLKKWHYLAATSPDIYLYQNDFSHIEQLETIFSLKMYLETNTVLLVAP